MISQPKHRRRRSRTGNERVIGRGLRLLLAGLLLIAPMVLDAAPAFAAAVYQIDAGSASAVSPFAADGSYTGGSTGSTGNAISVVGVPNAAPAAVYQTYRSGTFTYTLTGLTASTAYVVRLHFAESTWNAAYDRQFSVTANGATLLSSFDVYAAANGEYIAVVRNFNVTSDASGKITITTTPVQSTPIICGVEVLTGSAPAAPTGFSGTGGASQTSLTWTAVGGATSYNLYRSNTSSGEGSVPYKTGLTGTSYADTSVTAGTNYFYKLVAVNANGEGAWSSEMSPTPATPTNFAATATATTAVLTWTAAAGAANYSIYRGTTPGTVYGNLYATGITGTTYTDSGLTTGTTYYYAVVAVNGYKYGTASGETSATPNTSGTTCYQIACGSASAVSSFAADEDYSGGSTLSSGNTITVASVPNAAPMGVYQNYRYGTFTYTLIGLSASTVYVVRLHFAESIFAAAGSRVFSVTANGSNILSNFDVYAAANGANIAVVRNFNVTSDAGGKITITTAAITDNPLICGIEVINGSVTSAPTGLAATAGSSQNALTWSAVTGATTYNLYRSTTAGTEGSVPYKTGLTGTSYADTSVTTGTNYYYKLVAVNTYGESAASSEVSPTPGTPSSLAATAGSSQVTLTWTAPAGAATYNVYRGTTTGGESTTALATGVTGTSYTDSGVTNATTYYYTVKAVNGASTGSASAEAYAIVFAAGTYELTNAKSSLVLDDPSGLGVGTGLDQQNYSGSDQQWTFVSVGANLYTITSVANGLAVAAPTANSQLVLQTLTNSTVQEWSLVPKGGSLFQVQNAANTTLVWDDSGNSVSTGNPILAYSANNGVNQQWSFTAVTAGPSITGPPTNLAATSNVTGATLIWNTVSGATSYSVYRGTTSGGESATAIATGLTSATYADSGLTTGTTYYYTVKAVNSAGTSAASNEAAAVPNTTGTTCYQIACANSSGVSPFVADEDYSGGNTTNTGNAITVTGVPNAAPTGVYQNYRYGTFTYTLSGLSASTAYLVRLHFAESYFPSSGRRIFSVTANGSTILSNFDIYVAANGANIAVVRNFNVTSNSSGTITIATTQITDNPIICGIEVINGSVTSAPATFAATASASQNALTWSAATGAAGYNLYRSTTGGTEGSVPYKTGLTGTSYTDTAVTSGMTYYYKLVAVNTYGESAASGEVSTTPLTAPTGVTATPGNTKATIAWSGVTGATGYNILRSTTNGSGYALVTGGSNVSGTTFTDTGLTNATTYYYVVDAVNGGSASANSGQASVTPNPPLLLLATRVTAINGSAITGFVSDGAGQDTNAFWPAPTSTYLRGAITSPSAKPGAVLEYTVYFLVTGSGSLTTVQIACPLPAHTTFASTAYNGLTPTDGGSGSSGLALAWSSTAYPTAPTVYFSNAVDSDRGSVYGAGVAVGGVTAGQNVNGAVSVMVVTSPASIPAATSASAPFNAYGFVRYEVVVN